MGNVIVSNSNSEKRYGFSGSALPTDWTILQLGSGMSVTVSGGNLTIATGTTISAKTIVRCTKAITIRALVKVLLASISQRIANQTFTIQLVNEAGDTYASWIFDGTSATSAKCKTANDTYANTETTVTIPTTAAAAAFDISVEVARTLFSAKVANSTAADSASALFDRMIPEPNENYYLQFVVENGGSAPASTTNFVVDAAVIRDLNTMGVTIQGALGDSMLASSLSVNDGGGALSIDIGGTVPALGTGVRGTGVQRVTIATDDIVQVVGNVAADGAVSGNPLQMGARGSAVIPTAMSADGDVTLFWLDRNGRQQTIISAGSALDNLILNHRKISTADVNATSVKASAGRVYRILASNLNATVRYLKFYNKASAPAPATDNGLLVAVLALPPNSAFISIELTIGIYFSTGIAYAVTAGITDTDATAVAANEILINIGYI